MIEFDTKHDYIYCISFWVEYTSEFFLLLMRIHFIFNRDKNMPRGIVITFGKVVRPAGEQLLLARNISVS